MPAYLTGTRTLRVTYIIISGGNQLARSADQWGVRLLGTLLFSWNGTFLNLAYSKIDCVPRFTPEIPTEFASSSFQLKVLFDRESVGKGVALWSRQCFRGLTICARAVAFRFSCCVKQRQGGAEAICGTRPFTYLYRNRGGKFSFVLGKTPTASSSFHTPTSVACALAP